MTAAVTRAGFLDMQVCVPMNWSDNKVVAFAEKQNPCGTQNGWFIRREGNESLSGCPERVKCEDREGFVHIMLDA